PLGGGRVGGGGGGVRARAVALVVATAVACSKLGTDLNEVSATGTAAPDSLEQYDTLVPGAAALNGAGDTVPATILWTSLDSVLTVLNDTTGKTVVSHTRQTGRLQAHLGNLFSNPIAIRTLAAADTLFATGGAFVKVRLLADALPDSIVVTARARRAIGDTVPGSPVTFFVRFQP